MENAFDELAKVVARILAKRWLAETEKKKMIEKSEMLVPWVRPMGF